jgi:DNA polymerase II small subunit/DNA polymerase delta subunit B
MTKIQENKLRELIKRIVREEYYGEPNDALAVQSAELTSHLSEDSDIQKDIEDLEMLLKNPDPSRAKDYGSVEDYKNMLRTKIDKLKKKGE